MNNILTLIGRVGQEPLAISSEDSDNTLVTFDIAVDEYSAKGTEKKDPLWVRVEAWNGLGERIMKTVTKGRELVVTGRLGMLKYERKDGTKVEKPKAIVKLTGFHLCDARPKTQQDLELS